MWEGVGLGEVVDPCGLVLRKEKPIMIDWEIFDVLRCGHPSRTLPKSPCS